VGGAPEPSEIRRIAEKVASKMEYVLNAASEEVTTKKELLTALRNAAKDMRWSNERFYTGAVRRLLVREE